MLRKIKTILKHHKKLDKEDVDKLIQIYFSLKDIIGELILICNKYKDIRELNVIRKDIKLLNKIDHDIKNKVYQIQKRRNENVRTRKN